jgi:serine/threonine protein kinase
MQTQTVLNETLLGYRITKLIAEGGMANVYLGENNIGKKRAVKILKPFLLQAHPSLRQRFEQEARIITQLDHPNIRKVEAIVPTADSVAMLMDYLEGNDLSAYVESGHYVSTAQKLEWFGRVLSALGYAHEQATPVVHRDIKPSNIFVTKDGQVLLLDFGIAKLVGEDANLSHTLTQLGAGTPRYRSPEQVRNAPIDHRSDIYSLGVTLWVLLAGQVIYKDEKSEFDINSNIVQKPLPVLSNVSAQLNAVIQKATAKDPKDRFQSCYQFAQALQAIGTAPQQVPVQSPRTFNSDNTTMATDQTLRNNGTVPSGATSTPYTEPLQKPAGPAIGTNQGQRRSQGLFQKPFSFEGRIRRTEYGLSIILYMVAWAVVNMLVVSTEEPSMLVLVFVAYIPMLWFLWAQGAKRCHDRDNSGWFQLIPFYGLWMLFAEGDRGSNQYGDDPKS